MPSKIRVSVPIPEDVKAALEAEAENVGLSTAALVRTILVRRYQAALRGAEATDADQGT